jgi:hypothetical protein
VCETRQDAWSPSLYKRSAERGFDYFGHAYSADEPQHPKVPISLRARCCSWALLFQCLKTHDRELAVMFALGLVLFPSKALAQQVACAAFTLPAGHKHDKRSSPQLLGMLVLSFLSNKLPMKICSPALIWGSSSALAVATSCVGPS